jgi:predicted dehydrogenase
MREAIGGAADVALGVIGVGRWGRHWARVCNDVVGGRLVAVCDSNPARRADLPAAAHSAAWFSSAEQMVREVDLDAVVIATPTTSHAPLAILALEVGRHVLVEKPLAGSVIEARRIQAHPGGRVMVGHLLRHHPAIIRISSMIARGELGRVTHIVCDRLGAPPAGREETAWWALAPHDISVIRALLGADPESIQASSTAPSGRQPEDAMTAILNFSGGALGIIRVGGDSPNKIRRITVVGERRSVTFTDGHLQASLVHYDAPVSIEHSGAAAPAPVHEEKILGAEPLLLQAQHFVDCLRSGVAFASGGDEGVAVVRVLEAGSRALALGQVVPLGARAPSELS